MCIRDSHLYTGFEYIYQKRTSLRIPTPEGVAKKYYLGHKDTEEHRQNLWYDVALKLNKGNIAISKNNCEGKITYNSSVVYDNRRKNLTEGSVRADSIVLLKDYPCYPLIAEGTYIFKEGQYVLK